MSFKPGDKVIVNGGTIATITNYDEDARLVGYRIDLPGGSHDRRTDHIDFVRLELLAEARHAAAEDVEQPELPFEPADDDADD